jgi:5-methylcytosine-specific restriction protein A
MTCRLCQRNVEKLTEHHLIPRSEGKKGVALPKIWVCSACHRQIHALFTNAELATNYNTAERLKEEPRMVLFLNWLRKQDPNKHIPVRR